MAEYQVLGKSVPRLDALEKVTGRAKFCGDVSLSGMLYAKVLRSPHAHARIASVDTSRAEKLPGVRVVITGKDVPDKRYGLFIFDQHILARDVVRYAGEAVAAVAADTLDIAEKAIELIEVRYEELAPIFDVDEAWSENPPVVLHPELASYQRGLFLTPHLVSERRNVNNYFKLRRGDVEQGFREADLVMENRFSLARIHHVEAEPHVWIAQCDPDGGLTMWLGQQGIHLQKQYYTGVFGIPPSKIRVINAYHVGGSFGGKVGLIADPIVISLAMKTARPVKYTFTREEMFICGGSRVPTVIYIKDGVKHDGTLVAREMRILFNVGAYANMGPLGVRNETFVLAGSYRTPNCKVDSYGVYTNLPLIAPFRGFGSAELSWAIESHMDMLARKLGLDPAQFRERNFLKEGEPNVHGELIHSFGAGECQDAVLEAIDWEKKPKEATYPWKRGRGFAVTNKYSMAPTAAVALVKILEDGGVEVRTSLDEVGQGAMTVIAQITAEEFGLPMEKVKMVWGDTSITPYFPSSSSSRTTFQLGKAVWLACQDAKRQLFELVAPRLKVLPQDLETRDSRVYVKSIPSNSIEIRRLFIVERPMSAQAFGAFSEEAGEIIGKGVWNQPFVYENYETGQMRPEDAQKGLRMASFYSYAAQVTDLLVNIETGEVKIEKVATAGDMGFPVNPKMCQQQMEGALAMGIGITLWEEMLFDQGRALNPNLRDYIITTFQDMPNNNDVKILMAPVPHKDNPYGAKGIAEVLTCPIPASIANAVYDAVGVRITDLPITREKILKALKGKK